MPKHRETGVVSSLEKAHPVRLQAAGSDPYAAVRPYYALHASARNKGLCPHSDNHQLRWWLCSLRTVITGRKYFLLIHNGILEYMYQFRFSRTTNKIAQEAHQQRCAPPALGISGRI